MSTKNLSVQEELRAIAEAVLKHNISSRDLGGYLAGLGPSPEALQVAAEFESLDLPPQALAQRLNGGSNGTAAGAHV